MITLAPSIRVVSKATQNVASVEDDSTAMMSYIHIVETTMSDAMSVIADPEARLQHTSRITKLLRRILERITTHAWTRNVRKRNSSCSTRKWI
jgi:hypothetical protein